MNQIVSPDIKVVLFDLWKTLIHSIERDPILDLQELLGHNLTGDDKPVAVLDPEFMRECLTMYIPDPEGFMHYLWGRFQTVRPDQEKLRRFQELIARERDGLSLYDDVLETLTALNDRGYRLGVISNIWPFPVEAIFEGKLELNLHFEHLLLSFRAGLIKPEAAIFEAAVKAFGVEPSQCLMVGDNPRADVAGAIATGMKAALIDRRRTGGSDLPDGAFVLNSLTDLVSA